MIGDDHLLVTLGHLVILALHLHAVVDLGPEAMVMILLLLNEDIIPDLFPHKRGSTVKRGCMRRGTVERGHTQDQGVVAHLPEGVQAGAQQEAEAGVKTEAGAQDEAEA